MLEAFKSARAAGNTKMKRPTGVIKTWEPVDFDKVMEIGAMTYIANPETNKLVADAVASERERCAKVVDNWIGCEPIAAAIRKGE